MDWKYKIYDDENFIDKSLSLDLSHELKDIIDKTKIEKENIFDSYNSSMYSSTSDIIKQNTNYNENILINIEDEEDNSLIKSIYSNISFKVPENLLKIKDDDINDEEEQDDNKIYKKIPIDYSNNDIDLKNNNIDESFQFHLNNLKKYINENINTANSETPNSKLNTSFNYSENKDEFQKYEDDQKKYEIKSNILITNLHIYIYATMMIFFPLLFFFYINK